MHLIHTATFCYPESIVWCVSQGMSHYVRPFSVSSCLLIRPFRCHQQLGELIENVEQQPHSCPCGPGLVTAGEMKIIMMRIMFLGFLPLNIDRIVGRGQKPDLQMLQILMLAGHRRTMVQYDGVCDLTHRLQHRWETYLKCSRFLVYRYGSGYFFSAFFSCCIVPRKKKKKKSQQLSYFSYQYHKPYSSNDACLTNHH